MKYENILTLYKVIFKHDGSVYDIKPIKIINDNELYNIKDYKTIKDLSKLLKVEYTYLTTKIINNINNNLDLDFIYNNITKYLIKNNYIIIKDRF